MKRVLLVHAASNGDRELHDRLVADGYRVAACATEAEIMVAFNSGPDAMVLYAAPGTTTNLELLRLLRRIDPHPPVIMVCGSSSETLDALREGAYYVIRPPLTPDEASILVRRALADHARPVVRRDEPPPVLIGEAPPINAIREAVERLASKPTTVVITGESGTGKATVARLLHWKTNQGGPFLRCSVEACSERSLGVELFGCEREGVEHVGLLERADGGTLYLGEVDQIPLSVQLSLLRFVEEHTFRRLGTTVDRFSQVRLVVSTTRPLDSVLRRGLLRPELAYRLAVVTLDLPPLRERREDIRPLAQHFLSSGAAQARRLSEAALEKLCAYAWPGNVRELSNVVENARIRTDAECLELDHLQALSEPRPGVEYRLPSQGIDFCELERDLLAQALRMTRGNQTHAASLLGLTRDQIRYRMAKFGMSSRDLTRAPAA